MQGNHKESGNDRQGPRAKGLPEYLIHNAIQWWTSGDGSGMASDIHFPYASVYLLKARSWVHPWPHKPASCRAHVLLSGITICCSPWIYHHHRYMEDRRIFRLAVPL